MPDSRITYTPNLALTKLPANYHVWAQIMNDNLTMLDAAVSGFIVYDNWRGAWSNSTHYAVGDTVVDLTTAVIWTTQVDHTSSSIPTTFNQEQVLHPTYWIPANAPATKRGAWTGPGTSYNVNDFVLAGLKYAMCLVQHVSSASFDADVALGFWSIIFDFTSVNVPQDTTSFINATSFGVTVGTVANQSAALQAAIDYAEAHKVKLILPAGYIRIDNTIYLGRKDPVWIEGQQAHAFFGFTDNQIDDVTCLYCANLPSNVAAIEIGPLVTTGTRDGVTLKNVAIYRPTPSAAGAGDKGVWIKSCTKPCLEDMVIYGFDTGLYCGINSDGSRSTYLGNFKNVRIDQSGNYGGVVESCVDCLFDHCWFGGATLASMAIIAPTLGTIISNGNYWEHCTFVASQGTVPVNNCRVDVGFWNSFSECDFEQASGENFKADYTAAGNSSGHAASRVDVVLTNCWFNNGFANNTGLINMKDVNFEIIGGRAGTTVSIDSAIKVTQSFFNITTFDSCIVGMQITFQAVTGVAVNGAYEGLRIANCTVLDNSATGLPCVTIGAPPGRCIITNNRFKTTHVRGYTDAGEIVGSGCVFTNNVLSNNTVSDNYWQRAIGGPVLAFAGQTPKTTEYGVSQSTSSRLFTRHTADTGGIFHYFYKTRQTVPGGARSAVSSGDGVVLRRCYADDGALDQEVVREAINVDGLTGGSWEILTKLAAGSLLSRLKIDNTGLAVFTGAVKTLSTTVGALPAAATAGSGARAQVSDSTVVAAGNFGAAVVGAGANNVPVYSDGAAWRIG